MATEKGERRRAALVAAAAELLRSGGFDAVRHRAVAEKAGLPLASTTYYFASLDDLVVAAVEHSGRDELAEVRAELDGAAARRRARRRWSSWCSTSCSAASRGGSLEAVLLRYERFVGAGRRPYLAPLMREMRAEFDALLVEVLARAGVTARPPGAAAARRARRRHRREQPDRGRPRPARGRPRPPCCAELAP